MDLLSHQEQHCHSSENFTPCRICPLSVASTALSVASTAALRTVLVRARQQPRLLREYHGHADNLSAPSGIAAIRLRMERRTPTPGMPCRSTGQMPSGKPLRELARYLLDLKCNAPVLIPPGTVEIIGEDKTRLLEINMDIVSHFAARFDRTREEELSLEDYLAACKRDPLSYASAAERMLRAIGEPQAVDTRNDPRLSRLFANKVIKIYPAFAEFYGLAFAEFYGLEDAIEQVVSYFRHAAQGLEEKKQILYLLGPVGGGKSSIAERLKSLMQEVPFYAIKGSPVNESPLGLFDPDEDGAILEKEYGIPRRYLTRILSPWAVKRLEEFGGDIRRFKVVKRYPSVLKQVGIAKTEPGDARPNPVTRTIRTFRAWSARSTSASSKPMPRTIRTPTAFRAVCASPTRGCSSLSKCSRRRSRCCTRC